MTQMNLLEDEPRETGASRKSSTAYRTISEVAVELDVPQHVLRFWENHFPQVKPSRMRGSRRYYRPEDIDMLRKIKALLYKDGYTIKGAQKLVKGRGKQIVEEMRQMTRVLAPPNEEQTQSFASGSLLDALYSMQAVMREMLAECTA
jgi:DNA-binding transcriptional MerR regulator